MYKRSAQGWLKHIDFIILDEIVLQLAFILAYLLRGVGGSVYGSSLYRSLAIVLALLDLLAAILFNTMHNVLKRGLFNELTQTLKQALIVFAGGIIFLFSVQTGGAVSRIVLYLTLGLHVLLGYGTRLLLKRRLLKKGNFIKDKESMLVVLDAKTADKTMERLTKSPLERYTIAGVVMDQPGKKRFGDFP